MIDQKELTPADLWGDDNRPEKGPDKPSEAFDDKPVKSLADHAKAGKQAKNAGQQPVESNISTTAAEAAEKATASSKSAWDPLAEARTLTPEQRHALATTVPERFRSNTIRAEAKTELLSDDDADIEDAARVLNAGRSRSIAGKGMTYHD